MLNKYMEDIISTLGNRVTHGYDKKFPLGVATIVEFQIAGCTAYNVSLEKNPTRYGWFNSFKIEDTKEKVYKIIAAKSQDIRRNINYLGLRATTKIGGDNKVHGVVVGVKVFYTGTIVVSLEIEGQNQLDISELALDFSEERVMELNDLYLTTGELS